MKSAIRFTFLIAVVSVVAAAKSTRCEDGNPGLLADVVDRPDSTVASHRDAGSDGEHAGTGAVIVEESPVRLETVREPQAALTPETGDFERSSSSMRPAVPDESGMARQGGSSSVTETNVAASGDRLFPGLELSGYLDVLSSLADANLANNDYGINQAELGLAAAVHERVGVELAVAYDSETETFGLGAAFVDWHLWDRPATHHSGTRGVDHTGVIVGQFDVSFGIDYEVYASSDRLLVSEPTVVVETHGAWGDVGVQAYVDWFAGSLVAFAVNGFEASATVIERRVNLQTEQIEDVAVEVDRTPEEGFGAAFHVELSGNVRVGGSYAVGINDHHNAETSLMGFDAEFVHANVALKAEAIVHDVNKSVQPLRNWGYYAQGSYDFGRGFLVLRSDYVEPDGAPIISSWSPGVGYRIGDNAQFRLQYAGFARDRGKRSGCNRSLNSDRRGRGTSSCPAPAIAYRQRVSAA